MVKDAVDGSEFFFDLRHPRLSAAKYFKVFATGKSTKTKDKGSFGKISLSFLCLNFKEEKLMVRIILGVIAGFIAWSILWVGTDAVLMMLSTGWYGAHQEAFQLAAMTTKIIA